MSGKVGWKASLALAKPPVVLSCTGALPCSGMFQTAGSALPSSQPAQAGTEVKPLRARLAASGAPIKCPGQVLPRAPVPA